MATTRKERVEKQIAFRERTLDALYDAYEALAAGRVKSYRIDDRDLTYLDIGTLWNQIKEIEEEINELTAEMNGAGARKAVAVVPRDW